MNDPLGPIGPLHIAVYVLLGIAIGFFAGRRAPDGTEYRTWIRWKVRYANLKRSLDQNDTYLGTPVGTAGILRGRRRISR